MKTQSTTKGFAILSAAGMVVKLISLLYVPMLLFIIGDEGYGVYYGAYSVFAFVYVITNTGLTSAISKLVAELVAFKNYRDAVKAFKMARLMLLGIGFLMAVLMAVLSKPLASMMNNPDAYLALAALSPAVLLTSAASAYRGYFQGRGNMTATAVSQILEQIMNIVFSLLFASLWAKYGVIEACAGATIGTTAGAFASVVYLIRYYEKNKAFKVSKSDLQLEVKRLHNKTLAKRLINYSVPLTVNWGLQNAGNVIDNQVTMGRLTSSGLNYSQAKIKNSYLGKYQTLLGVPITIISALCSSVLPVISGAAAVNNSEEVKKGIDYAYKTCFLIAMPAAVGLAVLSGPIFDSIFPKYSSGAILMKYGAVVLVLMAIVQIQSTILQSIGKLYISTLYIVIGIAAKIILNYILIGKPEINILGAVYGSMVGFLLPLFLNNFVIKRTLNIKYNLILLAIKPLIAAAFMGVVVYLVQFDIEYVIGFVYKGYFNRMLSTIIAIGAGMFAYIYALVLIGGITKKDMEIVPARFRRFIPKTLLNRVR
ncbi:polysaccharide biosynthesis protein [Clostridium swellfunianum]|uniref:putative polysaccharide biosynthesis protein n=1 Tax=Clostridium swellfunianum TaxID=1367462 RepID=UPI00202FA8EA|nr:polysaccharide biosynthesis protein [Clostridium swellfunianum]MCM0648456.1 polysaccharide biosynthesis protein [Clostridium swellfunianum]